MPHTDCQSPVHLLPHDHSTATLPSLTLYWTTHTTMLLPHSQTDTGTTYWPPWPLPHFSSGLPPFRPSIDFRSEFSALSTTKSQVTYSTWLLGPPCMFHSIPTISYYSMQSWTPPQYQTTYLYCVAPPIPMTADKNLLTHIIARLWVLVYCCLQWEITDKTKFIF